MKMNKIYKRNAKRDRLKVIDNYLSRRLEDYHLIFNDAEVASINEAFDTRLQVEITDDHPLIFSVDQKREYQPEVDPITIELWNTILPSEYHITCIEETKAKGDEFIDWMDENYPLGKGASESLLVQYITAKSSSAFMGIQKPSKSSLSNDSMRKTLTKHLIPI
jgi:hypothetical protein